MWGVLIATSRQYRETWESMISTRHPEDASIGEVVLVNMIPSTSGGSIEMEGAFLI